ncbi:uncharacterized protein FIBRA_08502 [Fibroporia radiculosa]|uniref:O-methyltransferase C-terminal domain-containing protein n=1 Tax=Fibroporia radiculosa TaxID=599839 RepID=J4GHK2_9APHY|nr:uncharacterized protein FIBRA_08502 [Fibroporia radiculosa]CCM06253.1 predicted protein [Fibroporia radiculosa]
MSLELARKLPNAKFIVQDIDHVLQQAPAVWSQELPEAVQMGHVQFMPHDFFTAQAIKGAGAYLLRRILHDWSDENCIIILKHLKNAMTPSSRILIIDHVLHPTVESGQLKSAPPPLPANYGIAHMFSIMDDLDIMSLMNGMERTPDQLHGLAERAGLTVIKIWECRGSMHVIEMRLPEEH